MRTDFKFLSSIFTGNRYSVEGKLMIDVTDFIKACNQCIIYNITLIDRAYNPADAFTKINHNL